MYLLHVHGEYIASGTTAPYSQVKIMETRLLPRLANHIMQHKADVRTHKVRTKLFGGNLFVVDGNIAHF